MTTDAGHAPDAVATLTEILRHYVANPEYAAADVFATLHDAGLRIVDANEVES